MRRKILVILITLLLLSVRNEANQQQDRNKVKVGIGFFRDIIPDADMIDVQVSIKLWTTELNKLMGLNYQTQSMIIENIPQMLTAIKEQQIHLISMSSIDYITARKLTTINPELTINTGTIEPNLFVLLVHKDNKYTLIQDLKDKRIALPSKSTGKMVKMWLDTELAKNEIKNINGFFQETKYLNKESQLVLNIFFKQFDACIVSKAAFETMKKLNPQVGQELQIIQESPELVRSIVCLVSDIDEQTRINIIQSALKLDNFSYGKQFQTLFRFDKVVPISNEQLQNIENLVAEYDKINQPR